MTSEGSQVILVFHEYGEIQNGHTIHSKIQMSSAGSVIGDLPLEMGGTQSIVTRTRDNSVTIPMTFKDGLSFIETSYPTKEDLEKLPWIEMTQSEPWDPTVYDGKCSSQIEESNSTVEVRDNDETVFLDGMKEQWETVFTDTVYTDNQVLKHYREREEVWGEMNMEVGRTMGSEGLVFGKKDGEKGVSNLEKEQGLELHGELMIMTQVGECQIMYFERCLSIIIRGNEMFQGLWELGYSLFTVVTEKKPSALF